VKTRNFAKFTFINLIKRVSSKSLYLSYQSGSGTCSYIEWVKLHVEKGFLELIGIGFVLAGLGLNKCKQEKKNSTKRNNHNFGLVSILIKRLTVYYV